MILGFTWAIIITLGYCLSYGIKNISVPKCSLWFITSLLTGAAVAYLTTPVIGFFYFGFWAYYIIPLFVVISFQAHAYSQSEIDSKLPSWIVFSLMGLFVVVLFVSSSKILHHERYHDLLTVKSENEFDPEKVFLDQSQARFVDQSLSSRSANEILGKERGLASRYDVDTMRVQNINGQLRWVSPLKHSSFFRWMDDSNSPGYISVSVNEYSDSKLNTDDATISYGLNGYYFSTDVDRHVYQNGYSTTLVDDYTLEVNDNGKPYWVGSIVEPQIGFSGKTVLGIIIVDAKSGDIEKYSVEDAPEWVDRIYPQSVVRDQVTYWGKYSGSWWDGFVGNNVVVATHGSSIVFSKDSSASWYTGLQSNSGNDESSMGFMLIDTRTGVASYYHRSGITEMVAQDTIEGRVQEYGYNASYPVPYYIGGTTTFLSVLKDERGNAQGVGLVAYDNRSMVAYGENYQIALRRYLSVLSSNGRSDLNNDIETINIHGVIDRAYVQPVDSRLILTFTITNSEYSGVIFFTSADGNKETVLTRDGDSVSFDIMSNSSSEIQATNFTNKTIGHK